MAEPSVYILAVLDAIWREPPTTKSNFARQYATEIAELASRRLVTTKDGWFRFGAVWRITGRGLRLLEQRARKKGDYQTHRTD